MASTTRDHGAASGCKRRPTYRRTGQEGGGWLSSGMETGWSTLPPGWFSARSYMLFTAPAKPSKCAASRRTQLSRTQQPPLAERQPAGHAAVVEFGERIRARGKDVTIWWALADKGVEGNEAAGVWAKAAADGVERACLREASLTLPTRKTTVEEPRSGSTATLSAAWARDPSKRHQRR